MKYCKTYPEGHCQINVNNKCWTITAWYVNKDFQHKGFGRKILRECMESIIQFDGHPKEISYIWNGENNYVYEWLSDNFSPVSSCPIAVQKNAYDDDWTSHIYHLNVEKVLKYFDLMQKEH